MPLNDSVSSLDMNIIAEELADLAPHVRIGAHAPDAIEYHSPLIGQRCADTGCVYVVTAEQLESLTPGDYTGRTCFVCAGRPPRAVLESSCSVIWLEDVTLPELVVRMTAAFKRYMHWERDTSRALASKEPAKTVAVLSEPLFRHPICIWDLHFQTVYHGSGEGSFAPEGYRSQPDGSVWSASLIDEWAPMAKARSGTKAESLGGPFVARSLFSGREGATMLCKGVLVNGVLAATVAVDDIDGEPGAADFSKIRRLAVALSHALEAGTRLNTSIPGIIDECIHAVLSGTEGQHGGYSSTEIFGWSRTDSYNVAVTRIARGKYPDNLLRTTAERVCADVDDLVYTVFDHELLFIANSTKGGREAAEAGSAIASALKDAGLAAAVGVSEGWEGLGNLPLAFRQASLAAGCRKARAGASVAFRDVMLESMVDCIGREEGRPQTFVPQGLRRLRELCSRNDDDLADVLKAYLDCNCSITATSRALFMHRNTLSYKVEKIKRVMGTDLDDPDERLALSIALRMTP